MIITEIKFPLKLKKAGGKDWEDNQFLEDGETENEDEEVVTDDEDEEEKMDEEEE